MVTDSATKHCLSWSICTCFRRPKALLEMDFFFFFLFLMCCKAKGQETAVLAPWSSSCWEGKKAPHCCRACGTGPSTPRALPTQTPVSALAEGLLARVQHVPVSRLHALHWDTSSWQVFKKLEDLCCIPQGTMRCVITKCAQSLWASAALLQ